MEEEARKAVQTIKEYCDSQTHCAGCIFQSDVYDFCMFTDNRELTPALWDCV